VLQKVDETLRQSAKQAWATMRAACFFELLALVMNPPGQINDKLLVILS